jgi:hypothetical protein
LFCISVFIIIVIVGCSNNSRVSTVHCYIEVIIRSTFSLSDCYRSLKKPLRPLFHSGRLRPVTNSVDGRYIKSVFSNA